MIPACLPPRDVSRPRCRCRRMPAIPMPMCSGRRSAFPMRMIAATRRRMRRWKNISACSTRSALRAACWCRAVRTAATIPRCSMRWRGSPTACAASRWPTPMSRRDELRAWNGVGVRGLRFNHFFRDGQLHYRGGVPLSAAEKLAPVMAELGWHLQLWIDVKDLPRDHSGAEIAGAAGRDRSHGPHRCARRHRTDGFPEPAARGRRGLVLGQTVGRPSPQPQRA